MIKPVRACYYGKLNKDRGLFSAIEEAIDCVYSAVETAKRKSRERAEVCGEESPYVHYSDFSNQETRYFELNSKNIEYSEEFFYKDAVKGSPNCNNLREEAIRLIDQIGLGDVLVKFLAYRIGTNTMFAVDFKPIHRDIGDKPSKAM